MLSFLLMLFNNEIWKLKSMAACGSTHILSLAGCLPALRRGLFYLHACHHLLCSLFLKHEPLLTRDRPSNSHLLTTWIPVRPVHFYLLTAAIGLADVTVEFKNRFRIGISCAHITGPVPWFQSCCTDSSALTALLNSHFQWTSRAQHLSKEGVNIKFNPSVE